MNAPNNLRFVERDGILALSRPVVHQEDEYDESLFDLLLGMQRDHFWYQGRHALLLAVLDRELRRALPVGSPGEPRGLSAVDVGGGCGGWLEYLHRAWPGRFEELALADSSRRALGLAGPVVGGFATRYHVDLMSLPWRDRWDVLFLLDVLEHLPSHQDALTSATLAVRPGGLLLVTVPALRAFWSQNDVWVRHQRRYSRPELDTLAERAGLVPVHSSYFMFLLSPLIFLSRVFSRGPVDPSPEQSRAYLFRTHRTPPRALNGLLAGILHLENCLSTRFRFPWGTSLLGVYRRPACTLGQRGHT